MEEEVAKSIDWNELQKNHVEYLRNNPYVLRALNEWFKNNPVPMIIPKENE